MPCSCGNTLCPCGIPCYCSVESCQCDACAIALPNFCKICKKLLITDGQTDNPCSCFIGESTALIIENQDKPLRRWGNIPMPIGCFVPGKLIVNVLIPVPLFKVPHFIPQPSICWRPPPTVIQTDPGKSSHISEEDAIKPLNSKVDSDSPSTAEVHKSSDKSSEQSSDLSSSDSNCAQNQSFEKICSPPGFLPLTHEKQMLNCMENASTRTEERVNTKELSTFYQPSVMIGNISYPVGLADPVWILPNPEVCIAGSHNSIMKLYNPFYVPGPADTVETVVTYEKEYNQTPTNLNFEVNGMKCFTKEECGNLKVGNECIALPSSGNFNEISVPEKSKSYLIRDQKKPANPEEISSSGMQDLSCVQSQPLYVTSSSTSGINDSLQACPDSRNPENGLANQTSNSVLPVTANGMLDNEPWWSNIPMPISNASTRIVPNHSGTLNPTSKLQSLFDKLTVKSPKENVRFDEENNSITVSVNNEKNGKNNSMPLYIDNYTTENMEKLLASSK